MFGTDVSNFGDKGWGETYKNGVNYGERTGKNCYTDG